MLHEFMLIEQYLCEELTPKQKHKVDGWSRSYSMEKLHDGVFGKGVDRIILPYDQSTETKITDQNYMTVPRMSLQDNRGVHHKIIKKLVEHGYKVDDYLSGLTYHESNPKRKVKISRALQDIGIENENSFIRPLKVKDNDPHRMLTYGEAYAADPVRAAAKVDKQIVITRNKYDVAGMSTGRGWRSCMNLEDGCNRHYVPRDITHGTLSAYVTAVGDNEVTRPLGRMNLKPHLHVGGGETILKPEERVYGMVPPSFEERLNAWAENAYPRKPGFYMKNSSLYNDDGKIFISHNLHELDLESHQVNKATYHVASDLVDAYNRDQNRVKKDYDYRMGHHEIEYGIRNFHIKKLTPKQRALSIIHHVSKHSYDNDGDSKDYYDLYGEADADDELRKYATNNTQDAYEGIREFTPKESMLALDKIHEGASKTEDEEHSHLKNLYGELIDHAFIRHKDNPEFQPIRDKIADHVSDHYEFYHNNRYDGAENDSKFLGRNFAPMLSNNPRTIHGLFITEQEYGQYDSSNDKQTIEHMAKHTDEDLAQHILREKEDFGYHNHFIKHMIDHNPRAEDISHHLLNDMHYGYTDNPDTLEHEANHAETIKALARNTSHQSVFDRIKSRSQDDLKSDEIHNAMRENIHFGHTIAPKPVTESYTNNIMQKYLRYL